MGEAPDLRFHAEALRILAVAPRLDPGVSSRIAAAEAAAGRGLAAAVKEWYSLTGAEELLTLGDNACGVAALDDFLAGFVRAVPWIEFYGPRRVNTGYQAFVVLDGSDDPPVRVDGDSGTVPFAKYVRGLAQYKAQE
jgi:hypothetical protein